MKQSYRRKEGNSQTRFYPLLMICFWVSRAKPAYLVNQYTLNILPVLKEMAQINELIGERFCGQTLTP
jgi:hypothetical protein